MMWTIVRWDEALREWRVSCPVHGKLASYRNFWTANRDARQHNESCAGEENGDSYSGIKPGP